MIATLYTRVAFITILLALAGLLDKHKRRSTYVLWSAIGLSAGALIVWFAAA